MKVDILAFGAHPDDVEMGCGGTIAKSTSQGKTVGIIDLTRGELGTNGSVEIRDEEASSAASIIGAKFRINLGLEDGFVFNNKENQIEVIKAIRHYKPDIILSPTQIDRHSDHGKASDLIYEAAFLSGLSKLKTEFTELSPSELKLCVYLRLNLSTKEIATLLNITPKSVEIKRYRLRKKLNLSGEDHLQDFILGY